tara:strand:+ start:1659 stop:2375 length:717 start_codon:yes stop_codon:yes gene_type:complete
MKNNLYISFKNLIRNYRFHLSGAQTKLYHIESDSSYITRIRDKGFCEIEDYHQKNKYADNLLNHFEHIKNKINFKDLIKNKHQNKTKEDYRIYITKFFDEKILKEFVYSDQLNKFAKSYFKRKAKVISYDIWLDTPSNNIAKSTQIYHRDGDSFFLLKAFYYLSDVNLDNGPFQYMEKSHYNANELSKDYLLRFGSKSLKNCVGNKGTLILADTNGYHKGLKLKKNYRVMLNIMFKNK